MAALGLVAVGVASFVLWPSSSPAPTAAQQPPEATESDADVPYQPEPVATNRGDEIAAGFSGEVHPLLFGKTRLELQAHWTGVGRGRDQLERTVRPRVYKLFADFAPAVATQAYSEREFSAFLPESIEAVGQMWKIDPEEVAGILKQFHPRPSLHLVAFGRRSGPDGSFAILRAVSPTHLDVLFRIHAEFDLAKNVWLTPACFWGRMIVDKSSGTVPYFRMWVPTERPLNMHLTVAESIAKETGKRAVFRNIERGDRVDAKRDIVRVERMELASANAELPDSLDWDDWLAEDVAQQELQRAFYTFAETRWVPWNEAVSIANVEHRPILAVVLWGALDDQSC